MGMVKVNRVVATLLEESGAPGRMGMLDMFAVFIGVKSLEKALVRVFDVCASFLLTPLCFE